MRFVEPFTKTDTTEVPLMFVTTSSSCETYDLKTVSPNSPDRGLPIGLRTLTAAPAIRYLSAREQLAKQLLLPIQSVLFSAHGHEASVVDPHAIGYAYFPLNAHP